MSAGGNGTPPPQRVPNLDEVEALFFARSLKTWPSSVLTYRELQGRRFVPKK